MARTSQGKVVGDSVYVHRDLLGNMSEDVKRLVAEARELAGPPSEQANVFKVDESARRVSLLEYPDFFDAAFPALARSWTIDLDLRSVGYRSYERSTNPPILHRKELMLPGEHPRTEEFRAITASAEQIGLFDNPQTIGLQQLWLAKIRQAGYRLVGSSFQPLGNEEAGLESESGGLESAVVQRHRTALHRQSLSAPVQCLARNGFISQDVSVFDYGCGRGDDIAALRALGVEADGWDPHFRPESQRRKAHVVNLGFVINVIESVEERVEALTSAFRLAESVLAVSVMLECDAPRRGTRFRDGYLTSRETFQKYYQPAELVAFLASVLDAEPVLVAPGIAFVFADRELEQRFLLRRNQNRHALRLISARREPAQARDRLPKAAKLISENRGTLDALWEEALSMGRIPLASESVLLKEAERAFGSWRRAIRAMADCYDPKELAAAQASRRDDLLVYFALNRFSGRKKFSQLERRLQVDVKTLFGSYHDAIQEADVLLREIASIEALDRSCRQAAELGLGYYTAEKSLQVHASLIEQLPPLLRTYIGCGLTLYGDAAAVDLVKIHVQSAKLTLMRFDDFANKAVPLMIERTKVNLRTQNISIFTYGEEFEPMPLFYKSRYINEECTELHYVVQRAFDELLGSLQLFNPDSYGPTTDRFLEMLKDRRLRLSGFEILDETDLPNINDRCGKYFTYRDFVECGVTQSSSGLANVPIQSATYNALCGLAKNVIDPVIEYFGMIKLTYGFCCPELGRLIKRGIAPRLDQHASHELNRRGSRICQRDGAACDFIVDDENMREVAEWIVANTPFDRLYFYGETRPIHVSWSRTPVGEAWNMTTHEKSGRVIPRSFRIVE